MSENTKNIDNKRNCVKECFLMINCSVYARGTPEREICERQLSSCIQYKCGYSPFKDSKWFNKNIINNSNINQDRD